MLDELQYCPSLKTTVVGPKGMALRGYPTLPKAEADEQMAAEAEAAADAAKEEAGERAAQTGVVTVTPGETGQEPVHAKAETPEIDVNAAAGGADPQIAVHGA